MPELKTALVFGDNMVLQREKELYIWGNGTADQKIEVRIQGKVSETTVKDSGKWELIVPELSISENEVMTITSGNERIEYTNIAVGDVWIAGGQSNMEFGMYSDSGFVEAKQKCKNSAIRFFDYPKVAYEEQLTGLPHHSEGFWRQCDETNLKYYSAVGYYFAKYVQYEEHIPIGIIGCNWGGSTASCWMDGLYADNHEGKIWWDEYDEILKVLDMEQYEETVKTDFNVLHNDWIDTPYAEFMCQEATLEGLKAAFSVDMPILTGPKSPNRPSGLYETMLKKLVPYAMKGVIWYQGESDDTKAEIYGKIMRSLIKNWRDLWKEEFPFLFVQIAPYEGYGRLNGERYPEIREQQQWVVDHVENTAMAVITDVGARYDIHPKKKQPVGKRLALLAEKYVYGKEVLCESPTLIQGHIYGDRIVLEFNNAGEGLILKGNEIQALELLQGDNRITDYKFSINENRVLIQSDKINLALPIQAEMACTPYYEVNLYNSAGLPARPAKVKINNMHPNK